MVLIVDDDKDLRESLRDVLEDAGYQVALARHGAEALAYLQTSPPPSLILLDLMMPVMDGSSFCAAQQKDDRLAAIPVLVFSAAGALAEKVGSLGVAGHLRKPVKVDDLLNAVGRFCPP